VTTYSTFTNFTNYLCPIFQGAQGGPILCPLYDASPIWAARGWITYRDAPSCDVFPELYRGPPDGGARSRRFVKK